jgi:hypothetical protein
MWEAKYSGVGVTELSQVKSPYESGEIPDTKALIELGPLTALHPGTI